MTVKATALAALRAQNELRKLRAMRTDIMRVLEAARAEEERESALAEINRREHVKYLQRWKELLIEVGVLKI